MKPLRFCLSIFLVVVPIAYGLNFYYAISSGASGGAFGDTFGVANSIFSGGALMMLIYAVILQREELSIVREERDATREVLKQQEATTSKHEEALRRQRFEGSLHSTLSLIIQEYTRLSEVAPTSHIQQSPLMQASKAANEILAGKSTQAISADAAAYRFRRVSRLVRLVNFLSKEINRQCFAYELERQYRDLLFSVIDKEAEAIIEGFSIHEAMPLKDREACKWTMSYLEIDSKIAEIPPSEPGSGVS